MKIIFCFIIFLISNCGLAQDISVYSYDLPKVSKECIDDWIESSASKYNGVYTFKHFGTEAYIFEELDNNTSFKLKVETSIYADSSNFKVISLEENKLKVKYESGEELNARFVMLKCNVDEYYILKGVKGLLINEELLFLLEPI